MSRKIKAKKHRMSNLKVRFTDKPITVMGGMKLLADWFRKIRITEYMNEILKPLEPGSNRGYQPVIIVMSYMVSVLMGAKKLSHSVLLETDEPLKKMFGIEEMPSVSTFSRFFRKVTRKLIEEIFEPWNRQLLEKREKEIPSDGVTIDMDSSVFERFGRQEGVEVGYNPRRPGRPSHHPIFAVISELKFVAHMWLRRGKTVSLSGAENFLKELLARLPENVKIKLIRADSGFFSGKFFDFAESVGLPYMVVVRINPKVREIVKYIKVEKWQSIAEGIEIGEATYQAKTWKKARRIIVIRQELEERPAAQGKLFEEMPGYRYQVIITTLPWKAQDIWNCYKKRAAIENYIKELKEDYSLNTYSLKKFFATEAAMWFIVICWNLLGWFKTTIIGKDNIRLMTVRLRYFLCGGILGKEKGADVLRLKTTAKWRQTFLRLLKRVNNFGVSNAMQLKNVVAISP